MSEQAKSTLSNILEGLPSEQEELNNDSADKKEEEIDHTPEVQEEEDSSIITQKFAIEAGLPKSMIGKPMSEMAKAYKNLNAEFTKKSQGLSELGRKIDALENQFSQQATTKAEKQEIQETFEDIPDPVSEPEKFKAYMKNRDKARESEIEKRILNTIEAKLNPALQGIQNQELQNNRELIIKSIHEFAGKDVDVGSLINMWAEDLGLSDEDSLAYLKNPQRLIKSLKHFWDATTLQETLLKKTKEVGDKNVEKVVEKIKTAKEKKPSDLNTNQRTKQSNNPQSLELVMALMREDGVKI